MSRPTLPPGFRFHPTDAELVQYYLKRKVLGKPLRFEAISEIDIYKFAPWDLREKSCLKNRDLEWYFFCPRDKKYASGPRTNRTTEIGYWKTTGKDRTVRHNSQIVGMKKTLVFHTGRSPRGIRTDWVMHEYRLEDKDLATAGIFQGAYVLCRIFQKSGPGPRNGEQYGAPFREEDWEDDVNDPFSLPLADPGSPSILLDDDQNVSIVPGSAFGSSLEPIPCQAGPSNNTSDHTLPEDDDIVSLLALFGNEEEVLVSTSNVSSESPQSSNVGVAHLDGYGFYNSLEDIITLEELNKIHFPSSCLEAEYPLDQTHIWGSSSFLELKDLELPLEDPTVHGADNLFLDPLACNSNYDNIEGLPGPALPLALPALGLSRCNTLPEGSSIEEELAPFFKDNGNGANASGGQDALYNISSSSKNFQEGGKQQALARGGPQKASFSRLQYLLHSVPARPTFAAEYLFPTNREKGAMDSRMMYPYGGSGSSIQVKVDVIITCGSTKDGLSDKYEEFPCVSCYGCNLSWLGFGKQAVTRSKLVYIRFLTGNGFCFPDYWNYQLFTQSHPLIGISISIWKSVSILTSL